MTRNAGTTTAVDHRPMAPDTDLGQLLRAREVAALLAVSIRSVWRLAADGSIPSPVRVGGSSRWRASDIGRFIADQRAHFNLTKPPGG